MNFLKPLYPLVLKPVYQNYLWGGDRISRVFKRALPPGIYAESWEVSDRPEGESVVVNGVLRGWSLTKLMRTYGTALTGGEAKLAKFPALIKIIDAKQCLSVQVHPHATVPGSAAEEPKTEAWYVLDADRNAVVYAGFKPGMDEKKMRRSVKDKSLKEHLVAIAVKPGDVIYIPGGLTHAIGAGCLLLEVQQNSNTTYRIYDWGRLDSTTGKPRDLHHAEALRVINWGLQAQVTRASSSISEGWHALLATPFFNITKAVLPQTSAALPLNKQPGYQVLFIAKGSAGLSDRKNKEFKLPLPLGTSVLIPADSSGYYLKAGAEVGQSTEVAEIICIS